MIKISTDKIEIFQKISFFIVFDFEKFPVSQERFSTKLFDGLGGALIG